MSIVQPRTNDKITLMAARLARAVPALWEDFVRELGDLATERRDQCVQAASDKVFTMQGRAQQAAELHTQFRNAVSEAAALESKLKERK